MTAIAELRERSEALFTRLLNRRPPAADRPGVLRAAAGDSTEFSWFNPEDAVRASTLAVRLAALAAADADSEQALPRCLDLAEAAADRRHPEEVRQALALFVTHNREGRRLLKPRTVTAAPGLFRPVATTNAPEVAPAAIGGRSPALDYWREDPLANEHHQHWHEVYPYSGLPPRDFRQWLSDHTPDDLVAILNELQPDPGWPDFVASASPERLAELFADVLGHDRVPLLPARQYAQLFRLNDRQGELFFYMHQQMLARYDAELLSHGLEPVAPLGRDAWDDPVEAGHDPVEVEVAGFGRREQNQVLPADWRDWLASATTAIDDATRSGTLAPASAGDPPVEIDRTTLGEAVEAAPWQLSGLDAAAYPGLHNQGHVFLAALSRDRPGVMTSTVTAIRDQVFWQWHRFIDEINARWQRSLEPYGFADAPSVRIRDALSGQAGAGSSPDIILFRTADLPGNEDPEAFGERRFGGDRWDIGHPGAGSAEQPQPIDELVTAMASVQFGGRAIQYLTHEPFSCFIRVENPGSESADVTLRVFLVPAARAHDRRAWMELDKFAVSLPARSRVVVYRPDTESSVIKRPAETSPRNVLAGGGDPDEESYCDCGWPYTLLLPRGTREGMEFRMLVLCTDAGIDAVGPARHCGSMSYCGAVDRYPDTRDMGYPFSRPFAGSPGAEIEETFARLPTAAARTVVIRHA